VNWLEPERFQASLVFTGNNPKGEIPRPVHRENVAVYWQFRARETRKPLELRLSRPGKADGQIGLAWAIYDDDSLPMWYSAVFGGVGEGPHASLGHPSGMPEGSRGLRSAWCDDTPGVCCGSCIPAGCQILRGRSGFWHPARVRLLTAPDRGALAVPESG
jgi:hypothetical protein